MNRIFAILIIIAIITGGGTALAETDKDHNHSHDHDTAHHDHDHDSDHQHGLHSGWELGISAGWVLLRQEKEDAVGLHGHLMKKLGTEGALKYFSLGFGAETIFSEHEHYGLMATIGIHPWRELVLHIAPGVQWAKHEEGWESHYATHLELKYSFDIGKGLHLGPVVGYSKTKEEEHTMVGIHLGIPLGN